MNSTIDPIARCRLFGCVLAALSVIALHFALSAHAAEAPKAGAPAPVPAVPAATKPAASKPAAKPGVLDFEGEVIEGQKKTPELFLQTEVQKPALDSVLYQRRDFNDYHSVDARLRPRLSENPGAQPARPAARPAAASPGRGAPAAVRPTLPLQQQPQNGQPR